MATGSRKEQAAATAASTAQTSCKTARRQAWCGPAGGLTWRAMPPTIRTAKGCTAKRTVNSTPGEATA